MNNEDAKVVRRVLGDMADETSVQEPKTHPVVGLESTTDVAPSSIARRIIVPVATTAAVVGGLFAFSLGSEESDLANGAASTSEISLPPESSGATSTLAGPPLTTIEPAPTESIPTSLAPSSTAAPVVEATSAPPVSLTEDQGPSPEITIDAPVAADSLPPGAIPAPPGVGGPTTVAVSPVPNDLGPMIERFVSALPAGYQLTESGGTGDGAFATAVNESTSGVITLSITRQTGAPETGQVTRSDGLERRAVAGSDRYTCEVVATNKRGLSPESSEVVAQLAVTAAND